MEKKRYKKARHKGAGTVKDHDGLSHLPWVWYEEGRAAERIRT